MSEYLKKSEVLDALKEEYDMLVKGGWDDDAETLRESGIRIVRDLPTIKPPTGEWHEVGLMLLACSNCGKVIGCPITNAPDYCQNCGARMNGGEYPENDEIDEIDEWFYS